MPPKEIASGNMKIQFVDLQAQYAEIKQEIDVAVAAVIRDGAFIGGSRVAEFECAFAAYIGRPHCIGVANGTDALFLTLIAIGAGPDTEVIVPANTFIATSEAVTRAGARIVFVDCDEKTFNISPRKLAGAITIKTTAVIPVHLYGQPADMDAIKTAIAGRDITIIEDAAQAHGAEYKNAIAGALAPFACFSFYPGKNLGAYGDAGAILTDDPTAAGKIRAFANHGRLDKHDHIMEGVNSRLDALQAAVLSVKLKHLQRWNNRRRAVAEYYTRELSPLVSTPYTAPESKHVFHLYVIRVKNRDKIIRALEENGVSSGIHYPTPLPFLPAYKHMNHKPADFPVAHKLKDEILSLPIHGSMSDAQVEYVVENLKKIL